MASYRYIDASEVRRLSFDLGKAPADVTAKAGRVVSKTARDIEADAKAIVAVDTGNLKNSIGSDIDALSAVVGPTADYGLYVEEGTSRMGPQPYMRPAFDGRKEGFVQALEQIVGDFL